MTTIDLGPLFERSDTLASALEVIHGLAVLSPSVTVADTIATNQHIVALLELAFDSARRLTRDLGDAADRIDAGGQAADA